MTKPFQNLVLASLLIGPSFAFAEAPQCSALFVDHSTPVSKIGSFEIEVTNSNAPAQAQDLPTVKNLITQKLRGISATSIEVSRLSNGSFVILAPGVSAEQLQKSILAINQDHSLENLLKEYFSASNSKGFKISFSEAKEVPGQAMVFEGKHAYPEFDAALQKLRGSWDQRYPLQNYNVIGLESPFGTHIENAQQLVGLNILGIGVTVKRILSKPLESATIEEFSGRVLTVENTNAGGADPIWVATLQTAQGQKKVNLTDALGVRTLKGTLDASALSGGEMAVAAARRKEAFNEFKNKNQSGPDSRFQNTKHNELAARLARLPENDQKVFAQIRGRIITLFGQKDMLKRNTFDTSPRPLAKLKDESFRPMVEEVQRQLYDTDSASGFKEWLADFALEVYLDVYQERRLTTGSRTVNIRDTHANYPFAEGLHGVPVEQVAVTNIPVVTEEDVIRVIDRRAAQYGFDENVPKVPNLHLVKNAKYLATLEGFSLQDTTIFFIEYSKNNLLFQDTYFIDKPHGQYSHVFQWLYLAERMSQPSENAFGANMIKPLMKVQPYFMDDFATGVRVTDFVGQRAPQNPDYINNLTRLLFPLR